MRVTEAKLLKSSDQQREIEQLRADVRNLQRRAPGRPAPPSDDLLAKTLATGNGVDWLNLSARDRARLCVMIEVGIGQKEAGYYLDFLGQFYLRASEENQALLWKSIAETAAVAAAMP